MRTPGDPRVAMRECRTPRGAEAAYPRAMRSCWWVPSALLVAACSGGAPPAASTAPLASAVTTPPTAAHREPDVEAVACPRERGSEPLAPDATPTACHTDADCTEGQNGRCVRLSNHGSHGPALEASACSYDECFTDADCPGAPRATCWCRRASGEVVGLGHYCTGGECATDADCGEGHYCRRGANGRFCHSPADECMEDQPCPAPEQRCLREGDGLYRCSAMPPVYG